MSDAMYPSNTREFARERRELSPETEAAFQAFSQKVFADGRQPTKFNAERHAITGGVIDGPLARDNAISREAAAAEHIVPAMAGDADLLVPDLEAGIMLAKELSFLVNADAAGIALGARGPIILTSRADKVRTRIASRAVAALYAHAWRLPAAETGKLAG